MQTLKYDTNELIYKAEVDSQTQKTNLWLPKGKGDGGGINWEFGISRYKLLLHKIDKQQGPTVYHRELYSISCNKPQWKRKKKICTQGLRFNKVILLL